MYGANPSFLTFTQTCPPPTNTAPTSRPLQTPDCNATAWQPRLPRRPHRAMTPPPGASIAYTAPNRSSEASTTNVTCEAVSQDDDYVNDGTANPVLIETSARYPGEALPMSPLLSSL